MKKQRKLHIASPRDWDKYLVDDMKTLCGRKYHEEHCQTIADYELDFMLDEVAEHKMEGIYCLTCRKLFLQEAL